MNALWAYFWPPFGAGIVLGSIGGLIAFRAPRVRAKHTQAEVDVALRQWRRRRTRAIIIGLIASIAVACLWHGPLGAADRFATQVEKTARQTLDSYEMTQVSAHLQHGPLTRRIILSGPADDFQSSELVRIIGGIPGVSSAQWTASRSGIPLLVQGSAVSLVGFLLGLLLAYLVELRRRYNAQWNW
jgi:hypothetical protein